MLKDLMLRSSLPLFRMLTLVWRATIFISSSFNPLTILAGHSKNDEIHNSPSSARETAKGNEITIREKLDIQNSMEIDKDSTRMNKRGRFENI